jgi:hypothetical protein
MAPLAQSSGASDRKSDGVNIEQIKGREFAAFFILRVQSARKFVLAPQFYQLHNNHFCPRRKI